MNVQVMVVGGVVAGLVACGSDSAGGDVAADVESDVAADVESDTSADVESDTSADVESDTSADVESDTSADIEVSDDVAAADYCERIADSFCDFYVRCGRMAVDSVAACKPVFLETCNARYEPLWGALAGRAQLVLSASGLATCAAHLASVVCDEQILDLDGACAGVWRGLVAAGGACGPGLESFVCAPGTTCIIDLDFCGECVPLAPGGEGCDLEHRCPPTAICRNGTCENRILPGHACDADGDIPCVLGAGCVDGTCRSYAVVAVGDACDQDHRCPYKSVCSGGMCRETALLDEACEPAIGCASGFCDEGTCVPLGAAGDACDIGPGCVSGRCSGHVCGDVSFGCIE